MSAATAPGFHEANQRYLAASLALLAERVRRHANAKGSAADLQALERAIEQARAALPAPAAIDRVTELFGLSPFERDVLLLCAGIELDAKLAALCAAAQGDPRRIHPSFSLALAALPGAHWSAITPEGPLRRYRLIEVGAGDALTSSAVAASERVLHYLTGISYLDERLQGLIEPASLPERLPPSQEADARRVAELWSTSAPWPVIHLAGDDPLDKRAVAAAACGELGLALYALRASDVPAAVADREGLLRLWAREARLIPAALFLDADDLDGPGALQIAASLADHAEGPLIVGSRAPFRLRGRAVARVVVQKPAAAEQRALWEEALGPAAKELDGQIDAVVGSLNMSGRAIAGAGREALRRARAGQGLELWDVCRSQARPSMDDLAQRITPAARWDDLVLPEAQIRSLRDIVLHVRHRPQVYQRWGFGAKASRGLGVSALFAGPSGTGKTMAAEVLARALDLDLYCVDLSQIVSKFIGETEKNLRRIFDAADEGSAILLFDEADALFGKRTEVRDSHDRYANIEVSYLLQRMEAYQGLAILTTNMKNALDAAFSRRLRFIVSFPFPDAAHRAEIWRRAFPGEAPVEGLDLGKLARLSVSGGNIRNIALSAAFLAADAGEPVRMSHLLSAAKAEYGKLERPLTDAEVGGWV